MIWMWTGDGSGTTRHSHSWTFQESHSTERTIGVRGHKRSRIGKTFRLGHVRLTVPIDLAPEQLHVGGRVIGWTGVVYLDTRTPAEERFTKKGRQAIARAE